MLLHRVRQYIAEHRLLAPGARVLVGVSGGVDSVVLLTVLKRLGYAPVAAHVNYGLRGAEADADAALVKRLCAALAVPLHAEAVDGAAYAEAQGQGVQAAARDWRYRFFARVAEAEALPHVAVAHHLDDQAETVLLNLLRGAGPEGLAGMPPQRPLAPGSAITLIRPLLDLRRAEIEAYAREAGLAWRDDASNRSLAYQRNVLREAVLPLLEAHFGPSASATIARSARLMREYVDDLFQHDLAAHFDRAARSGARRLGLEALRAVAPVWRRRLILEALQRWLPDAPRHAALAAEIEALIEAQPGRKVVLGSGAVWRARDGLVFAPPEEPGVLHSPVLVHPGQPVALGAATLCVDLMDDAADRPEAATPTTEIVDADALAFPLVARRWQPGDRLQPLGMAGTKKVSDLLTDLKVPVHRRADVQVLLSGDMVVWVIGLRLAHRVRTQPGTTRFAKFTYIQPG